MPEFETSVTLRCPADIAFDFLIRPANAIKVSPPSLGLTFLDAPAVLELGSKLQIKVQTWGQVVNMVHEITIFDRPNQFVEKQISGMFKMWQHEHHIETTASGDVLITDRIQFEPPGGLVGLIVTKDKILDQLEDGFFHRHGQLRKLLENSAN